MLLRSYNLLYDVFPMYDVAGTFALRFALLRRALCFLGSYMAILRSYILLYILVKFSTWCLSIGRNLRINLHNCRSNCEFARSRKCDPSSESSQKSFELIQCIMHRKIRIYRAEPRANNECTWIMKAPATTRSSCNITAFTQRASEQIKNFGMHAANFSLCLSATLARFQKWQMNRAFCQRMLLCVNYTCVHKVLFKKSR